MTDYRPRNMERAWFLLFHAQHARGELYADKRTTAEAMWDYLQEAYDAGRIDATNAVREALGLNPLEEDIT